ncbi:hypothetical protein HHI36_022492 [Cryptolaemus montrouzieri]|uniref:Uncharacterized protein n=1 Tax=Cryptolaemus montrouzieri TaxID=559131 RepID=A0ABD2MZU1_9CUCU
MKGRRTKNPMKNADQPKTAVPLTKTTHTAVSNSVNGAVKMSDNGRVPNSVNEAASKTDSEAVSNSVNDVDMDDNKKENPCCIYCQGEHRATYGGCPKAPKTSTQSSKKPAAPTPPAARSPSTNTTKIANSASSAPINRSYAQAVQNTQRKDETAEVIVAIMPQITQIIASSVAAALISRNG